ncbi:hypothetical protein PybrP1_008544 [[Pythium] brassicae (nom. inval.)]|nr:hypothetical protein PybrP1_008544 [[Pythium] brassicae (nom. inval.)]
MTLEFELQNPAGGIAGVSFCTGTRVEDDELKELKRSRARSSRRSASSRRTLPSDTLIRLEPFGTAVYVHEIGFPEVPRPHVFRGNMAFTTQQNDAWPVVADQRPQRCTGVALSVCVGLLKATSRDQSDLQKCTAPLTKEAVQHYQVLADRSVSSTHVVDIFACLLGQSGVMEMKSRMEKTGGVIVLADSRTGGLVLTSREFKVSGVIDTTATSSSFTTKYQHASGRYHTRAPTICSPWTTGLNDTASSS